MRAKERRKFESHEICRDHNSAWIVVENYCGMMIKCSLYVGGEMLERDNGVVCGWVVNYVNVEWDVFCVSRDGKNMVSGWELNNI